MALKFISQGIIHFNCCRHSRTWYQHDINCTLWENMLVKLHHSQIIINLNSMASGTMHDLWSTAVQIRVTVILCIIINIATICTIYMWLDVFWSCVRKQTVLTMCSTSEGQGVSVTVLVSVTVSGLEAQTVSLALVTSSTSLLSANKNFFKSKGFKFPYHFWLIF